MHRSHTLRSKLGCLAAFVLAGAAANPSLADIHVGIRPVPGWADLEPLDTTSARSDSNAVRWLLIEDEVNRITDPPEALHRAAYRVGSEQAVEDYSRITADFDPSYQTLDFHFVRIRRDGRVLECLARTPIQVLRREPDLEASLLGGKRTALLVLDDVRIGDVVEYVYTIRGRHPVLGAQYAAEYPLQYPAPLERLHRRLLWPADKTIWFREHDTEQKPLIRPCPGGREYVWTASHLAPFPLDDDAPAWFYDGPRVQVSTFTDWGEVARWGAALFRAPTTLSHALRAKIAEIQEEHSSMHEQTIAAIRFVQDEIRYQGIETGSGSMRPTPPDVVLARRYGDCKDKTLLLATLLRALGTPADVALVDHSGGHDLPFMHPSPILFDHAIVRIPGGPFWIDATRSLQRGGALARMAQPDYGWALVLRDDTQGLTSMKGVGVENKIEIQSAFTVGDLSHPTTMEVQSTYRGAAADAYRSMSRQYDRHHLTDFGREYYSVLYPDVLAERPIDVADDEDANVIVTREHFRIPEFWGKATDSLLHVAKFTPQELVGMLPSEPEKVRRSPFGIKHPSHLVYETQVTLPKGIEIDSRVGHVEDPFFRFDCAAQQKGQNATLTYEYQSLQDEVPRPEVARFASDREVMLSYLTTAVFYEGRKNGLGLPRSFNLPALLIVLLSFAAACGAALRLYRWRPAYVAPGIGGLLSRAAFFPADPVAPPADVFVTKAGTDAEAFAEGAEEVPLSSEMEAAPGAGEEWIEGQPIGGWLWLFGLGLILTPVEMLLTSRASWEGLSSLSWIALSGSASRVTHPLTPFILLFEPSGNAVLLVFAVLNLVLFVQRRKTFPRLFAAFMLFDFVVLAIDLTLSLLIPDLRDQGATGAFRNLYRVGIASAIWLTYLHRSKRARATFVR